MKSKLYFLLVLFFPFLGNTQSFAPAVGFEGSTAIHKDSSLFVNWATEAVVSLGYKDIALPQYGFVSYGTATDAVGKVEDSPRIVSLGDGGEAILTFENPIVNGKGADFAVFENAFFMNDTSELAFLELAFVEVSTDGQEYIRFPAISEIQPEIQTGSFEFLNARYIYNFAGKYTKFYGTPFDLEDLKELVIGTNIDLNEINYVKIIDVVGSINPNFATYDSLDYVVNDPYPTAFESGGFDLDAVGVIHDSTNQKEQEISIYPNPATDIIYFTLGTEKVSQAFIYSLCGKLVHTSLEKNHITITSLDKGIYVLELQGTTKAFSQLFIKSN